MYLETLKILFNLGCSDSEIASVMRVSSRTIKDWSNVTTEPPRTKKEMLEYAFDRVCILKRLITKKILTADSQNIILASLFPSSFFAEGEAKQIAIAIEEILHGKQFHKPHLS